MLCSMSVSSSPVMIDWFFRAQDLDNGDVEEECRGQTEAVPNTGYILILKEMLALLGFLL